jgi:outer membrane protein assembly factor BamB
MTQRRAVWPRAIGVACALALVGSVSACDWFDWLGTSKSKTPLPGKRIAVLQTTRDFEPDARLADEPVKLPRPQRNSDWPQAGGYPDHVMFHLELPDQLKRAWNVSIGSGTTSRSHLYAGPVVANGRVFAIDTDGDVSAFNLQDGSRVWSTDITPEDESSAVVTGAVSVYGTRVFVTSGYAEVLALDADDGKIVWRAPLTAPVRAAPTLSGDRVFVTTVDNQLIALAADDGRKLWDHAGISEAAGLLGGASAAVDGGTVIAAYSSGELFALRADNGRVAWAENLAAVRRADAVSALAVVARPVVDRGLVLAVSHSGRFAAVELRSGGRVWDREVASANMPWVAGEFVYILTTSGDVLCMTRRDGRIRWVQTLPRFEDPEREKDPITWTGPVLGGDRLIVVSSSGDALSISPYTGKALGRLELYGKTLIAPVIADGTLLILSDDGDLAAYR